MAKKNSREKKSLTRYLPRSTGGKVAVYGGLALVALYVLGKTLGGA